MSVAAIKNFIYFDRACDCTPGVSTAWNLTVIFLKCVCKCLPESVRHKSRFWSYIEDKNPKLVFLCFLPILIGNIFATAIFCNRKAFDQVKDLQKIEDRFSFMRALCKAMKENNLPSLEGVKKPDTYDYQSWRTTPLLYACYQGNEGAVRWLLERGAKPNFADENGKTPLTEMATNTRPTDAAMLAILKEYETPTETV